MFKNAKSYITYHLKCVTASIAMLNNYRIVLYVHIYNYIYIYTHSRALIHFFFLPTFLFDPEYNVFDCIVLALFIL